MTNQEFEERLLNISTDNLNSKRELIKQLILDLIGENEYGADIRHRLCYQWEDNRNGLREELRQIVQGEK
jgi:hypothetical protein